MGMRERAVAWAREWAGWRNRHGGMILSRLGRLRKADRETGNAWLFMAYAVLALACAAEAVAQLGGSGPALPDALCAFALTGLMACAAFRPVSGSVAVLLWWMALCVSPMSLPSAALLGALLAVGVLGYVRRGVGAVAAVAAIAVWVVARSGLDVDALLFGRGGSSMSVADVTDGAVATAEPAAGSKTPVDGPGGHTILGAVTLNGAATVAVLFAGFLLGGLAVRWGQDRDRMELGLRLRRQRERAARDIHDYVSNDLAYVILRLDRDIAEGRAAGPDELRELRAAAAKALGRTHEVIALLEGEAESGGGGSGAADAGGAVARIRQRCEREERRLRVLGFDGQTIVAAQPDARLGSEAQELLDGLLGELYANIARHADPAGGYVLTVRLSRSGADVALADTVAERCGDAALSCGTGLERYRRRIERLGGALHVTVEPGGQSDGEPGGEWSLAATIPA